MNPAVTASSLFLLLAYSWFIAMELLLHHHNFLLRASVAAVIVLYAVLTLVYTRTSSTALGHVLAAASLTAFTLGFFGVLTALRQVHFEGYLLILAVALLAQGILTFLHVIPRPRLHRA